MFKRKPCVYQQSLLSCAHFPTRPSLGQPPEEVYLLSLLDTAPFSISTSSVWVLLSPHPCQPMMSEFLIIATLLWVGSGISLWFWSAFPCIHLSLTQHWGPMSSSPLSPEHTCPLSSGYPLICLPPGPGAWLLCWALWPSVGRVTTTHLGCPVPAKEVHTASGH